MKYTQIDRDLLIKLISKQGGAAQFGLKINRSKGFVEDALRSGILSTKTIMDIKVVYGVDITALDQDTFAQKNGTNVPIQQTVPSMPQKNKTQQPEQHNSKDLSEIINRVDKIERNINDMAVTLRLMLDIMQTQEKRTRNKPFAR